MTGKRALITGVNGFSGRHLARHLGQQGYTVAGLDLTSASDVTNLTMHVADIRDSALLLKIMHAVRPTHIYHLAALVSPNAEFEALLDVNVRGTERLLEAVRLSGLDPLILITSSSGVYGLVGPGALPIRESQPFRPASAYAVSKVAQEMLAYSYHARYGMRVIRTRTFNMTGPGEPATLVCSALARQIAEAEARKTEAVLRVGNLTPQRDFVDVRDTVRAYRLALERGQPGEVYNVCSGQSISIEACLEELQSLAEKGIRVEQDPTRMRPSDLPMSLGDCGLLQQQTGWRPAIPLRQSLAELLEEWRRRM